MSPDTDTMDLILCGRSHIIIIWRIIFSPSSILCKLDHGDGCREHTDKMVCNKRVNVSVNQS